MTKDELAGLLGARLPVNASRDQLHAHVRGQQKLIEYLAHSLATQGRSILELRDALIEPTIEPATPLVGFDEPKVILP